MVDALSRVGHRMVAPLRGKADGYTDVKARRVKALPAICQLHFGVNFGDAGFLNLIETSGPFDIFCHHASEVRDYRNPDFDTVSALLGNVQGLVPVLRKLRERGCRRMLLTGSVFEPNEGIGPPHLRAFSPYGLSKGLTAEYVRYYAWREDLSLGKFVIANPFGPLEEPRFLAHLFKNWLAGQTPSVKTPSYLRDNIHVDLLALAYRKMVETLPEASGYVHYGPSYYVESMGEFSQRVATEISKRIGRPCPLKLETQTDFSEPMARVNPDRVDAAAFGWSESEAWDKLANYYLGK